MVMLGGSEWGLVAPADFKSVGGYRKVSVLGSIPRRFRHSLSRIIIGDSGG